MRSQFYATKKRKAVSPVSKAGRTEKGARHVDGSPSAKGSLDSYLVTSQDDCNEATTAGSLVKRNLASEIGSSLENGLDKLPVSSAEGPQQSQATRPGPVDEVLMAGGPVVGDPAQENNCSDFGHGAENTELKQFKAEFLSFYCGYFTLFE